MPKVIPKRPQSEPKVTKKQTQSLPQTSKDPQSTQVRPPFPCLLVSFRLLPFFSSFLVSLFPCFLISFLPSFFSLPPFFVPSDPLCFITSLTPLIRFRPGLSFHLSYLSFASRHASRPRRLEVPRRDSRSDNNFLAFSPLQMLSW